MIPWNTYKSLTKTEKRGVNTTAPSTPKKIEDQKEAKKGTLFPIPTFPGNSFVSLHPHYEVKSDNIEPKNEIFSHGLHGGMRSFDEVYDSML